MRFSGLARDSRKIRFARNVLCLLGLCGAAAISIEALVRAKLTDFALTAPSRFYARPVVLETGQRLDRERLERSLTRLGYERVSGQDVSIGQYNTGTRQWTIGRRAFRIYDQLDPGGLATLRIGYRDRITEIRSSGGNRVSSLALEPEVIRTVLGAAFEDRIPISLADAPGHLVDAVLAIEDQRFFEHTGIDARRIVGASLANVRARRIVQGASTITQQLVKNLFLSPERSVIRKTREVAIARALEVRHSKEEILQAYLNEVYLGQDGARAIHGVGRAAQFFFGKDISQLAMEESALLAGIIRGPSLYSPFRNPLLATSRRDLVLNRMLETGKITEEEHQAAIARPLHLRTRPLAVRSGRYFIDHVADQLREGLGESARHTGLSIFTTLDMELQKAAERSVHDGLVELERYYPRLEVDSAPLQAALVALDPQTGEILAMVGGRDYGLSQFNRASQARRQPGSAFKPIVALAALTQSDSVDNPSEPQFTLASVLEDRPLSVRAGTGYWSPENYDGQFRGRVTLRESIEGSLNVPFARLGMEVGPESIVNTARSLGIQNRLNPVLSLALGSSEVTPLELTRAYNVLAAGGYRADTRAVSAVLSETGRLVLRETASGERAFEPAEAYLVTSALRGAVERGTGSALRAMGFRGPVAGKSGTTNNYRDAWFIGYTPSLTVGIWVGFDDGRNMGLSGSRAALPIFAQFLIAAQGTDGENEFEVPHGLEVAEVDRQTGLLGGPGCSGDPEVFLRGTAPENSCSPHWASSRRYRSNTTWRTSRITQALRLLEKRLSRGTN